MAELDPEWVINEIDAFLQVTAKVVPDMGPGIAYLGTVMSGSPTEAAARAHVVEMVLDRALPGWRQGLPVQDKECSWLRGQASRAKTVLERRSEPVSYTHLTLPTTPYV